MVDLDRLPSSVCSLSRVDSADDAGSGFFELAEKGEPFGGLDYAAPTPDWAVYGAPEAGFSPEDERWFRKKAG